MGKTINVTVRDNIASAQKDAIYVCGNSDYVIRFDFDAPWQTYQTKTARFRMSNGMYQDIVFSGTECGVPVIRKTNGLHVGVFAGDLHTTTAAWVQTKDSITSHDGTPAQPAPDVYAQIMEELQELNQNIGESIRQEVETYITENPIEETDPTVPDWAKAETKPGYTADEVGAIAKSELQSAIDTALAQAKASGQFDGAPGAQGAPGANGVSCTHSWNGTVLTVTSASGTSSADLKGERGEKGDTGAAGADGKDGAPGAPGAAGADGKDGAPGADGVSCTHSWSGTVLTVTSASGTSSADLKGEKGDKGDTGAAGADGKDGAPGAPGAPGSDGYTPVKGTDYFTAADKEELVADVLAALPTWDGGSY